MPLPSALDFLGLDADALAQSIADLDDDELESYIADLDRFIGREDGVVTEAPPEDGGGEGGGDKGGYGGITINWGDPSEIEAGAGRRRATRDPRVEARAARRAQIGEIYLALNLERAERSRRQEERQTRLDVEREARRAAQEQYAEEARQRARESSAREASRFDVQAARLGTPRPLPEPKPPPARPRLTWEQAAAAISGDDLDRLESAWLSGSDGLSALPPVRLYRLLALLPVAATPAGLIGTLRALWRGSGSVRTRSAAGPRLRIPAAPRPPSRPVRTRSPLRLQSVGLTGLAGPPGASSEPPALSQEYEPSLSLVPPPSLS